MGEFVVFFAIYRSGYYLHIRMYMESTARNRNYMVYMMIDTKALGKSSAATIN